jgi:hypothetical protein
LKARNLWFQLAHPAEQQDYEQHDQQTKENAGCVHKATLLGEYCIKRDAQTAR